MKNAYEILAGKLEGNILLVKPWHRREDNKRPDLRETG
jgi:hypothetical protein